MKKAPKNRCFIFLLVFVHIVHKICKKLTLFVDYVKKMVDFCDEAKSKYVILTGGEPTLYPQLINTMWKKCGKLSENFSTFSLTDLNKFNIIRRGMK